MLEILSIICRDQESGEIQNVMDIAMDFREVVEVHQNLTAEGTNNCFIKTKEGLFFEVENDFASVVQIINYRR